MWTEYPTGERIADCRPPFSFFFDLVEVYWKAKGVEPTSLHRICTLARKQGATAAVVECALAVPRIRDDIAYLDESHGGAGTAEAWAISFFANPDPGFSIASVADDHFLGQAIVINYRTPGAAGFDLSYVFEAAMRIPTIAGPNGERRDLLNNFIYTDREIERVVLGRSFCLRSIHYCQQNDFTHTCAHACIRMALIGKLNEGPTPKSINALVDAAVPSQGLTAGQIEKIIRDQGLVPEIIKLDKKQTPVDDKEPSEEEEPSEEDQYSYDEFLSMLASVVESGDMALLVFTTGENGTVSPEQHVVVVYGHTRHTDEWHPEAIPDYSGDDSAPFHSASKWIDHFLIHDDNYGPYYTLSSRAFEFDKLVKPKLIIAIRSYSHDMESFKAENIAAIQLANFLPTLDTPSANRWLDYMKRLDQPFVLRPIVVSRERYVEHLQRLRGHDGSRLDDEVAAFCDVLPERFWMVEFSFAALFTGNHSKLGEVLLATTMTDEPLRRQQLTLAIRVPGTMYFLRADGAGYDPVDSGLDSHARIWGIGDTANVW